MSAQEVAEQQSPDEAERIVKARQEKRRREQANGGDDDGAQATPHQAVRKAAKGEKVTDEQIHDALEVFLAAEGEEPEVEPKALKLNVGSASKPRMVKWVIQPVDEDEITAIRRQAAKGNRAQKRRGEAEVDENLVARRIVSRATVEPDLGELAQKMQLVDPTDALVGFFRKFGKTGLILQISGEVLNLSGYDEDDVNELDAALG